MLKNYELDIRLDFLNFTVMRMASCTTTISEAKGNSEGEIKTIKRVVTMLARSTFFSSYENDTIGSEFPASRSQEGERASERMINEMHDLGDQ